MSSSVSLYLQDQVKYFLVYHRVALKKCVHFLRCHLTSNADSSLRSRPFFCSCPSFLDEPREETLATQATLTEARRPRGFLAKRGWRWDFRFVGFGHWVWVSFSGFALK